MSFSLTLVSRYIAMMSASLKSIVKRSFLMNFTWSVTPASLALALLSLMRSGSMSTPTPFTPYFFAAVTTMRPSPQPRS